MANNLEFSVKVDWDLDGNYDTTGPIVGDDISRWVQNVTFDRGFGDDMATVARTGVANITLNNVNRYFSPDNTTGPLFGKLLPRRPVRIAVRVAGIEYAKFTGYINRITPEPGTKGTRRVVVECTDLLGVLNEFGLNTPILKGYRGDQLVQFILNYALEANFSTYQLDSTGVPINNSTITINGTTYRFVNTLSTANDVLIGTRYQTIRNLKAAINGEAGSGTLYHGSTVRPSLVQAIYNDSHYQLLVDSGALRIYRLNDTTPAAIDYGINLYNGEYIGGYTQNVTGALIPDTDGAVTLNGTTGYIRAVPPNLINANWSVAMWAKATSVAGVPPYRMLFSLLGNTSVNGGQIAVSVDTSGQIVVNYVFENVGTPPAFTFGAWNYIVMTFDYATKLTSIYVNGVLAGSGTAIGFTQGPIAQYMYIGSYNGAFDFWPGQIDDVAIWLRTLSAAEVTALYAARLTAPGLLLYATVPGSLFNTLSVSKDSAAWRSALDRQIIADGAVRYYANDETAGTTATDQGSDRINGTYTGSPTLGVAALTAGDSNARAMTLDAVNDVMTFATTDLTGAGGWSVEWVMQPAPKGAPDFFQIVWSFHFAYAAGDTVYCLLNDTGELQIRYWPNAPQSVYISMSQRYHCLLTYNPTGAVTTLYLNGEAAWSAAIGTLTRSNPNMAYGAGDGGVASFAKGTFDGFAIYKQVLTAAQARSHYIAAVYGYFADGTDEPLMYDSITQAQIASGASRIYKLDETTGATATNLFGGNNGTYNAGVLLGYNTLIDTEAGDSANRSIYMNTTSVTIPVLNWQNIPFAFEAVILPDNPPPAEQSVFTVTAGATNFSVRIYSDGRLRANIVPTPIEAPAGTIKFGQKNHIILSYDGANYYIYVNGALIISGANGGITNAVTLMAIGLNVGGATNYRGYIDQVALYQKHIAPARAAAHYAAIIDQDRFELDPNTYDYAGDTWRNESVSALAAITQVTDSARGLFYIEGDGRIVWRNRDYLFEQAGVAAVYTLDGNAGLPYGTVDVERVSNRVLVEVVPRGEKASGVVGRSNSVISVPGRGSVTVTINYVDPGTGQPMAVDNLVLPLVPDVDFQAGENEPDDFYTNFNWLDFVIVNEGTSAKVTISNRATGTLKIFNLQLNGTGILRYDRITLSAEDLESQRVYQKRTLSLNLPLPVDPNFAQLLAIYWLNRRKDAIYRIDNLDLGAKTSNGGFQFWSLEIGDIITITEPQTGVTNAKHMIIGLEGALAVTGEHTLTLRLRRLDDETYGIYNDPAAFGLYDTAQYTL